MEHSTNPHQTNEHSPVIMEGHSSPARRRMPMIIGLVVAVLFLAGATYFVRNTTIGDAPVSSLEPARVEITVDGFSPATVKLKKGQQITWTNTSPQSHTIAAGGNGLDALDGDLALNADESQTITVENTGTFQYHDTASTGNFNGTIIVE